MYNLTHHLLQPDIQEDVLELARQGMTIPEIAITHKIRVSDLEKDLENAKKSGKGPLLEFILEIESQVAREYSKALGDKNTHKAALLKKSMEYFEQKSRKNLIEEIEKYGS